MAKKRDVRQFENALVKNTRQIQPASQEPEPSAEASVPVEGISPQLLKRFEELATAQGIATPALLELALEHFLRLEHYWFDAPSQGAP